MIFRWFSKEFQRMPWYNHGTCRKKFIPLLITTVALSIVHVKTANSTSHFNIINFQVHPLGNA